MPLALGKGTIGVLPAMGGLGPQTAYDELLTARSTATGRNGRIARLVAVLNASHLTAEAATALGVAGTRPPPLVISEAAAAGTAVQAPPELPEDETLKPITEAVRALLGVLGSGQLLTTHD